MSQEQIYENLRLHKEVLSSVKQQPWAMRRKLRLVQQAKAYVKRHEGALQERLAQSKTTRDILASCNIMLIKVISFGVCVSTLRLTEQMACRSNTTFVVEIMNSLATCFGLN